MNSSKAKFAAIWVGIVAVAGGAYFLWQSGRLDDLIHHKSAHAEDAPAPKYPPPELLALDNGVYGLKLSKVAIESLDLKPVDVEAARKPIPLPPMIGTINYDNERLFSIKPRFTGEIAEIRSVEDQAEVKINGFDTYKPCQRPIKFGDKVKQGDVLAVIWSRDLGEKKAALVDAIVNLRLSQDSVERQSKLFAEGAISLAGIKQSEQKMQLDINAVMTAERTLRMWKLADDEIKTIKDEANTIHDQKKKRDVVKEVQKWARVEVTVPRFLPNQPDRELTILEKNTHVNDMVDPANYGTPLFRIADLSRVQIWAHPPEEYLPILRNRLKLGSGALKWNIRFQSEPANSPGMDLDIAQISPSLEPTQHTPMMIGYLDNPEGKYLIGQFVTATVLIPPTADTVAIPTEAINPVEGKNFVFIVKPGTNDEFLIRRVSVAQSFKMISLVRSKVLPDSELDSERAKQQPAPDAYKVEPLLPGERIVTRGVLELTAALEEARNAGVKGK